MRFDVVLAASSSTCALLFCVLVVRAHSLRSDLDPLSASLSTYFTAPTRALMFFAYVLLAMALIAVAGEVVLIPGRPHVLSAICGGCCVLAAVNLVPVGMTARKQLGDPDVRSPAAIKLHRVCALCAFVLIVAAMQLAAFAMLFSADIASVESCAIIVSSLALVNLYFVVTSIPGPHYGLIQKALVGLVVAWLLLVSVSVIRL